MKTELKELFQNKNYLMLLLNYSNMYGIYSALSAIINYLVNPYEFDATDSSLFGIVFIFAGLVSSFVVSGMVDRNKQFLRIFRILTFASWIGFTLFFASLPTKKNFWVTLNIAFLGGSMIPLVSLGFTFSVELTHPISEAMSNGVLILVA